MFHPNTQPSIEEISEISRMNEEEEEPAENESLVGEEIKADSSEGQFYYYLISLKEDVQSI